MVKRLYAIVIIFFLLPLCADNVWNTTGNVGIGTSTPTVPLHITSYIENEGYLVSAILSYGWNRWVQIGGLHSGRLRGSDEGYLVVDSYPTGSNNRLYFNLGSSGDVVIATGGGNVGIGSSSPTHRLTVNGSIRAKEIIVDTGWADDVFAKDYSLPTLPSIEAYVQENGHLPGIPDEEDVIENGISLGEMNLLLLRKIEEMTLHMIRLEKEVLMLKSQLHGEEL